MFLKIINSKIQLKGSSAMNLTKDREKNEKLCYFISINGVHCALRIHDFFNTVECKSLCLSVSTIFSKEHAIYSNDICW